MTPFKYIAFQPHSSTDKANELFFFLQVHQKKKKKKRKKKKKKKKKKNLPTYPLPKWWVGAQQTNNLLRMASMGEFERKYSRKSMATIGPWGEAKFDPRVMNEFM